MALNIPIPLLDVDNKNICNNVYKEDGIKTMCPLTKGVLFIYKDDIHIIKAYPKVNADIFTNITFLSNLLCSSRLTYTGAYRIQIQKILLLVSKRRQKL